MGKDAQTGAKGNPGMPGKKGPDGVSGDRVSICVKSKQPLVQPAAPTLSKVFHGDKVTTLKRTFS